MKKIGSYMAIFGLFAIVMGFLDRVPKLLIWIYNWGETTAWIIKVALVVIGGILFFMGNTTTEESQTSQEA